MDGNQNFEENEDFEVVENEILLVDHRFLVENRLTLEGLYLAGHLLSPSSHSDDSGLISRLFPKNTQPTSLEIEDSDFEIQLKEKTMESFRFSCLKILPTAFKTRLNGILSIDLAEDLKSVIFKAILDPIGALIDQLIEFIRVQDEENLEKFRNSVPNQLDKIYKKLPKIFNELYGKFVKSVQNSEIPNLDQGIYVKIYKVIRKTAKLLTSLSIFTQGAAGFTHNSKGFSGFLAKITRIEQILESNDLQFRKELGDLDFNLWAKREFEKMIPESGDTGKICSRLADKKWSDTNESLNHYWVLCFDAEDLITRIDPNYTYISKIEEKTKGKLWVLHRRSHDLANDPMNKEKTGWNNWHRDDMKTLDFAVRDELSRIDVLEMTKEDLLKKSHEAAITGGIGCKSVITSAQTSKLAYCSFGEHPNAAGRVIRSFGRISIFIGF